MNIVLNMVTGEVETMSSGHEAAPMAMDARPSGPSVALQLVPVASCAEDKWRAIGVGIFSRSSVFSE